MSEILLTTNKNDNCIELINKINSIHNSLKVYKIIFKIDELLNSLNDNIADILIIEYDIFRTINILDFYKLNDSLELIIVLSENSKSYTTENTKCVFAKQAALPHLLSDFVERNTHNFDSMIDIKAKITKELKQCGYNLSYNGTKYLIECIYYLYINEKIYDDISINSVYSVLSRKYNKTANNIKCNITRATNMMFYDSDENKLKQYLGLDYLPKVGTKVIIQTVLSKLYVKV